MKKNIKFWIMFLIVFILSISSQLLGQVNSLLTISPTANEMMIGGMSTYYRNPAYNILNTDSTIHVAFTKVNWMTNIVDDMGWNYFQAKYGEYHISLLQFNYGERLEADVMGQVQSVFSPRSTVYSLGWGTELYYKKEKLENVTIGFNVKIVNHNLYTEKGTGYLVDTGLHFKKLYNLVNLNLMLQNWGYAARIGNVDTNNPSSLNIGLHIPIKDFDIYNQWNFLKGYYTHGQGISYQYNRGDDWIKFKAGYYNDVDFRLNYPSLGMEVSYDKYQIGIGVLQGNDTHPLRNTMLITINMEL